MSATLINTEDRVDHSQILYVLKPPLVWNRYRSARLPGPKTDQHGRVTYEKWPKDPKKPEPLLDFPHLPDQVGNSCTSDFIVDAHISYRSGRKSGGLSSKLGDDSSLGRDGKTSP